MNAAELEAEEIFRNELLNLGNETKCKLIELLASSLTFSSAKEKADSKEYLLEKAAGAWCDDGMTAEEEIEFIRNSRVQGKTRKTLSL